MADVHGIALSWRRVGDALEVELHRGPINEIGTATLDELERLAEYVTAGADGARALILYSSLASGFCAGADLRELHEGMAERRQEWVDRVERVKRLGRRRSPQMAEWLGWGDAVDAPSRGRLPLADGVAQRVRDWVVRREIRRFIDRIHDVFDALDAAPMTTIAAVHGPVFGGGFELALCCDVIVADKSARFCFPELRLGIVPGFGGIPRLKRDVGNAVVRDLLLTGRSVGARRAYELGLVSQVVARGRALEVARKVGEQAARFDPSVTAAAKSFLKPQPRAELRRERDLFCRMVTEPGVFEALEGFVESESVRPYLP